MCGLFSHKQPQCPAMMDMIKKQYLKGQWRGLYFWSQETATLKNFFYSIQKICWVCCSETTNEDVFCGLSETASPIIEWWLWIIDVKKVFPSSIKKMTPFVPSLSFEGLVSIKINVGKFFGNPVSVCLSFIRRISPSLLKFRPKYCRTLTTQQFLITGENTKY